MFFFPLSFPFLPLQPPCLSFLPRLLLSSPLNWSSLETPVVTSCGGADQSEYFTCASLFALQGRVHLSLMAALVLMF